MVFASVYTGDGGHTGRLYDHDHHEPSGHREGEIASATVRQYVQCVQDTVDRGRTAYVHQRTLRETCTIRVLQFLDNPRIRDHQESEHNRRVQELHSVVSYRVTITINFTRTEWRAFHPQFFYTTATRRYVSHFLRIKKKKSVVIIQLAHLLAIKISYEKKFHFRVKKKELFFSAIQ